MKRLREISGNAVLSSVALHAWRSGRNPETDELAQLGCMLEAAAMGSSVSWADESKGKR